MLKVIFGGLVTAAIFGVANGALSVYAPWSLTSLLIWFVFPAGAAILGALGALGAGFASKGPDGSVGAAPFFGGIVFGALTVLINYFTIYQFQIYPTLLHHPDMSFITFLNEYFALFTLGASDGSMGEWGVVMGWVDFVGGAIGGVLGASWAAGQSEASQPA
jgi:hypothetical protein